MKRIHVLLVPLAPAIVSAMTAGGCTVNVDHGPQQSADGTTPIGQSQASALVTGTVDPSVSGNVQMSVNGRAQPVVIAPDQTFVIRDVPTGDVTLECDAGAVRGTLTISGVQQGENVQVTVKREGDAIVIVIVARTPSSEPPREVSQQDGGALEITASHVCYWLKAGTYARDIVVKGDDVHLFGASHASCLIDDFSILQGKLELDGNDITVLDVDLTGTVVIHGQRDKVQDSCTKCFDQGCEHACGDEDKKGHTCGGTGGVKGGGGGGGTGGGGSEDAGAPRPDGGRPQLDAGAPMPDAAPLGDAGNPMPDSAAPDTGTGTGTGSGSDAATGG